MTEIGPVPFTTDDEITLDEINQAAEAMKHVRAEAQKKAGNGGRKKCTFEEIQKLLFNADGGVVGMAIGCGARTGSPAFSDPEAQRSNGVGTAQSVGKVSSAVGSAFWDAVKSGPPRCDTSTPPRQPRGPNPARAP
ncbi:hypothetical protein ACIQU4_25790 [Streptomyces sp. NPDC090741]|uniref:hypothetical protein n=1 Tax=Streptomyces sp. NPDC090741 TaxID=3365967 RepID=UPI0038217C55